MEYHETHIDPDRFECYFDAFKSFVEDNSGQELISFASNPYLDIQEGYKCDVYREGRKRLGFQDWKQSEVGSGKIALATRNAIEFSENNLVQWNGRYGREERRHQLLHEVDHQPELLEKIEACLFRLYRDGQDQESFTELVDIFGKIYPLLAYLFFLKDRSRYLPIAPEYFDKAFRYLGAPFATSRRCSWENYSTYLSLVNELREMLAEILHGEVTLLNAHSFAWVLSRPMTDKGRRTDIQEYLSPLPTERDSVVKTRIGQGKWRQHLIAYWSVCAVTGCADISLLRASHIKPWAQSSRKECRDPYNGLLLSPTLDACFDQGYISFEDDGRIKLSPKLSAIDAEALGISAEMKLSQVDRRHCEYLQYHRNFVFQGG